MRKKKRKRLKLVSMESPHARGGRLAVIGGRRKSKLKRKPGRRPKLFRKHKKDGITKGFAKAIVGIERALGKTSRKKKSIYAEYKEPRYGTERSIYERR